MQQKLTNQLIQNSDASMKTPLPPSLAVSLVSGICPSTTPVRNKRLPLTKEIKKKKKDVGHTNSSSSNNSSSSSSSNSSGDGITSEFSMSAGKKTLTIDDLLKCPGCLGYFEKSVFLTHSFSCSSNLSLNHSHDISKNSLALESNPVVIVTTAEKLTSVNSVSSLSATKPPSPISISDSTDEDDDDDEDSCIVIETGNGNPARREEKTDSPVVVDYNANSISLSERSEQRFHIVDHNELTLFPATSTCNLIEEALENDNASASNFHRGGTPATRGGHYKKPSRPCPFCGVMQAKLTRHIQLKHKEEKQVKEAMSLPPYLQRNAFNEMKKEGIRKENLRRLQQVSENGTELIKERSATTVPARCPSCNEFFPYNLLPQHLQNCNSLVETGEAMIYDFGSKDDGEVYQSMFTEAGVNEQLSHLPTVVLKVENDMNDESSEMVDVSSIPERGLSEKSLSSVVEGIDCYKKPNSIVETPISIEVPSNRIGLQTLKENNPVPDVCMPDVLQIHASASHDHDEKLSIEHCEDTVTLNLGNSGRNMNFSKGASNAIQVENALDLNMQFRENSLTLENLRNPNKGTNCFVPSSHPTFSEFGENTSACFERDTQHMEHFPVSNKALLCEEKNLLSLPDARDETSYLATNNVFAEEHPERRRSYGGDVLEESDEERTNKSKAYKKPFRPCPFCSVMQAKLTRHIKLKHKNEERVKEALKLPPHEQRFAFNEFKREGLMLENLGRINTIHESDGLNCDPVPQSRVTMTVCPYCKGSYTKDVIWEHIHSCQTAPFQINVSNWLLRQESNICNFDMIQTVNDKTVNPNFVIPPGSSLASSSPSLSISRREGRLASFSDGEEKPIYGESKEPGSSVLSTADEIETPRTIVPGSTNEYSKRIGYPCNQSMTTMCIKTEPSPYSQELTKEPQNNFGTVPEKTIPGCNLRFGQKTVFGTKKLTKTQPSASGHEQMAQVVSSESENCSQMIDLLPFFTKKESDGSSEIQMLQESESHAVKMLKDVGGRSGEELSQTADFSLVPIKQEISVDADAEAALVQVFDMRADSPVSISDASDEDCSIVSSESSVFIPPGTDQPTNTHANTQVTVMRSSDKNTAGRPQMYKKPSRPCLFCGVMQAKLSRHIKLKHKDEKRVHEAMQMGQPMQRQVFNQFKKEGIERENLRRLNDQSQPKDLIPMRTTKPSSSVSTVCLNCKVSVQKDTIKEHMDICGAVPSDASSSNCFQEQEPFAVSQSVMLPYSGHVITGGNTFVQASYAKDNVAVPANIQSVSCSSFDPLPSLEVKKEMVGFDCLKSEDEHRIRSGSEIMKANDGTMLDQPVGPVLFASNREPRYCLPQNCSSLNNSHKQPSFTFGSETNPTSTQNTYSAYCEPHVERELQKESHTEDAVRDLYDLPSNDPQTSEVDHFKKETEDSESCSAPSSLIFISDSSDGETAEGAPSQYETSLLTSMTTNPGKHSGRSENNGTIRINGGRSYKKPSRPCPFCGVMQAKLTRHIQLKHKDEPRVRSALGLPQPYQRQAFSQFKKEGIMKENMRRISNPHDNEGLISERLPPEKMLNVSCCECGELYPRDFISKHMLGCSLAVASLGLATASTMMVLEDTFRPYMMGFKSHSDTDQRKEFVLKMRQATSLEFEDGFYEDLRKVLKGFRENKEDMEMDQKLNHKNEFLEDSMKISQAIGKAFVHPSSKPLAPIQKQNRFAGNLHATEKETYSHLATFVKSKLLNGHDFTHKNYNSTFVDEISDKNLPDIIPRRQNTVNNISSPLIEIDLTADISVSKIQKPLPPKLLFFKGRIQKGRSYKRPFRPCLYCGIMQAKLSRHIMLKHKKRRPLRRVPQVSPPLKSKAFVSSKKEGLLNKNVRNVHKVIQKKTDERIGSSCSASSGSRFANEGKSFRLSSSLAGTGSGLFKSSPHFVASVKRQCGKYQPDNDCDNRITVATEHAAKHLDRLKLQLPDITSHTEQKIELKSATEEIVEDGIVPRDGFSSSAQGMDLADSVGCLAKADTPAEKEPMPLIKTEPVALLEKEDPASCLWTTPLSTTSKPENLNPDHNLTTFKTNRLLKIPQVLLKACGSSVFSDTDHKKCMPSITSREVAYTIPACRVSRSEDVSLNSTCLTDICLGIDAGERTRRRKLCENAAVDVLPAKSLQDFEKFSPEEGAFSGEAESKSGGEVNGCPQIITDGPKNGVQLDTVKLLNDSNVSVQIEKMDQALSAIRVERTRASSVGTESAELESTDNGSKLKQSSNFSTLGKIPYSGMSIKTEVSLPPSPISSIMTANDHSKELITVSTLQDIAQDKLRTKQELEVCKIGLRENNGRYILSQMPKPKDIVCFDTIKTDISAEEAPIVSSLDSITDNTDCATFSQIIMGHLGEEIPAGQIHRSYNFCEGANKNGRSASGGNNGGGSGGNSGGGGGGGGGGQMSSAQNSSRDSGSSTTSGRNGTGSCSFGRGGSTNRKPPTPCPFCGVRQAKLKRHIQLRHKDEERVKKALQLPPNLQRDVFHQFKEEGLANERSRVKDNSGTAVSSRVGSGNRSSSSSTSSTATSSGISSGSSGISSGSSGSGGSISGSVGSSTSGRGTPTVGSIGAPGVGGTPVRCSSSGSSRSGIETSKIECITSGANIVVPHDPSALKVLCPLCDTYYEKDVLQMHMIGCSSALSHFNASDWLTGPVPLGASDAELEADFLSERSSDLVHDPNQMSLTAPLLKEEYESPIASCSVGSLSYKEFPGYMITPQQQQQQQQQTQQHHHHQQHPGQNFSGPRNSFVQNLEGCQQLPPNYSLEMGQNEGPGNAAAVSNPYAVPPYHGGRIGQDTRMGSAPSWNQHYHHHQQQQQQQQMYHHHHQQQQQLLHTQHPHPQQQQQQQQPIHHHQQQQQKHHQQHRQPQQQQQPSHAQPPPPQQHLQPPHHHQQQHLQPPPALSQQQQQQQPPPPTQAHHQRPMPTDPAIMYMKSPKQEFPTSSSSFHQQDNFMLSSSQMGSQMPDPQIHHRPPQLYSPNSGHGKRATSTASPHDYGSSMYNSPSHPQMSPSGGAGYHYTPHHQVSPMLPPSPSPKSCGNFPHIDDSGYPQMMPQHCMSDQGIMRSPPVAPHLPPPPPNRHAMMQMDVTQAHGNIPIGGGDNNNNNNINNSGTGSPYLANRQINTGGNTSGNMTPNTASNYRSPMYHMGPGTVSPSPNSSFHHSPVASPSLSSTSSSSSKNSAPYHYSTLTAVSSTAPGTSFSGSMYGLPDLSSSASSIGDNCRLSYDSMGHSNDGISMSQQGHQMQSLPPQQLQPPPALPPPTQQQQQQTSLLPLQSLPSLMDDPPPPTPLLPSMSQMTSPRNHSASTTPAASGASMTHLPFGGGGGGSSSSNSSSSCSNNQIDPNCIIGGSCDPTCGDGDRFGHMAGNIISFHEGSSKDLADEISTAIDSHEDSSCGSSTTSGSGLSTTAGGADWNSCTGSGCPSGSGNNGSTPALLTSATLDSNNASNSSGSSSCGGSSPRGYSKLRNYKKPARPCPFCGVMQAKLTRHIKLKHKEDKRVVEALGLPQPLKRQAFSQFKKEGIMKQARTSSGGPSLSSADLPSS